MKGRSKINIERLMDATETWSRYPDGVLSDEFREDFRAILKVKYGNDPAISEVARAVWPVIAAHRGDLRAADRFIDSDVLTNKTKIQSCLKASRRILQEVESLDALGKFCTDEGMAIAGTGSTDSVGLQVRNMISGFEVALDVLPNNPQGPTRTEKFRALFTANLFCDLGCYFKAILPTYYLGKSPGSRFYQIALLVQNEAVTGTNWPPYTDIRRPLAAGLKRLESGKPISQDMI